jgi:excisionase family DNA binding protein
MLPQSAHSISATSPIGLRPSEAAALLSVSPRTLWSWTRAGLIPAIKIGRLVLYRREDLERFLADRVS